MSGPQTTDELDQIAKRLLIKWDGNTHAVTHGIPDYDRKYRHDMVHEFGAREQKISQLLSDALDCLKGETPEDMTPEQAKAQIIDRLTLLLRYGEIE